MVPYFEQPTLRLGPVTLHAFGALVAAGVAVGYAVALRRARSEGLDVRTAEAAMARALVWGFVAAHLFAVLAYFPGELRRDPAILLRFWEELSSFGGVFGGAVALGWYLRRQRLDPPTRLAYADVLAYAFPFAWTLGRLACTVAHDHPGRITTFPLAVSLESAAARLYIRGVYAGAGLGAALPGEPALARMGFHDLGWYEFLYLAFFVAPLFLWMGRRRRSPGFFLAALILVYAPVRFALDFLRVGDARYFGLTPAQYAAVLSLLLVPMILGKRPASPAAA